MVRRPVGGEGINQQLRGLDGHRQLLPQWIAIGLTPHPLQKDEVAKRRPPVDQCRRYLADVAQVRQVDLDVRRTF